MCPSIENKVTPCDGRPPEPSESRLLDELEQEVLEDEEEQRERLQEFVDEFGDAA